MTDLAWSDFAGAEGTAYTVTLADAEHALVLESARELRDSGRPGGCFSLTFRGPFEPILAQAIYPLRAGDFACEMFIVPIARDDSGTQYEAIFN